MPNRKFLQECEREPLAYSGAIQPHGSLLVLNAENRIVAASENVGDLLGGSSGDWLRQFLPLQKPHFLSELRLAGRSWRRLALFHPGHERDVHAFALPDEHLVLEFFPDLPMPRTMREEPQVLAAAAGKTMNGLEKLVREIALLTGFDRVLYYHFLPDEDGEVLAEARQPSTFGTYLGLRFPASDIPQVARQLYRHHAWRMIPDSQATSVPIHGIQASAFDMSYSCLRSVSPVHQVYLANMGVRATVSLPVFINHQLVAMVAAHHQQPCVLPWEILEQAANKVATHAASLSQMQIEQQLRLIDGMNYRFDTFIDILQRHGSVYTAWPELAGWICQEFNCDGAVWCQDNIQAPWGTCVLDSPALDNIDNWFCTERPDRAWFVDSLRHEFPALPHSEVAGLLAIKLHLHNGEFVRLYLCRQEMIYEVAWGGNPDKPVEHHDGYLGISPRRSFEKWLEKRFGYSRPWARETQLLALRLRELLVKHV